MDSWDDLKFWNSPAYMEMCEKLWADETISKKNIFPLIEQRKKAFELTPIDQVKVVILGQDPYPTKGHAHGLAFSVQPHVKPLPPTLRNIFAEYMSDLGYPEPNSGDLSDWASAGVLLLNTILTVEEGKSLSHRGIGWEKLTYEVLRVLSGEREHLVFMLFGRSAQEYRALIDETKHLVISTSHPSPLGAKKASPVAFLGSRPFSRANAYRKSKGLSAVEWKLR